MNIGDLIDDLIEIFVPIIDIFVDIIERMTGGGSGSSGGGSSGGGGSSDDDGDGSSGDGVTTEEERARQQAAAEEAARRERERRLREAEEEFEDQQDDPLPPERRGTVETTDKVFEEVESDFWSSGRGSEVLADIFIPEGVQEGFRDTVTFIRGSNWDPEEGETPFSAFMDVLSDAAGGEEVPPRLVGDFLDAIDAQVFGGENQNPDQPSNTDDVEGLQSYLDTLEQEHDALQEEIAAAQAAQAETHPGRPDGMESGTPVLGTERLDQLEDAIAETGDLIDELKYDDEASAYDARLEQGVQEAITDGRLTEAQAAAIMAEPTVDDRYIAFVNTVNPNRNPNAILPAGFTGDAIMFVDGLDDPEAQPEGTVVDGRWVAADEETTTSPEDQMPPEPEIDEGPTVNWGDVWDATQPFRAEANERLDQLDNFMNRPGVQSTLFVASFFDPIDYAVTAIDVTDNLRRGEYWGAVGNAGMAAIPVVPGNLDNMVRMGFLAGIPFLDEAWSFTKKRADDAVRWGRNRPNLGRVIRGVEDFNYWLRKPEIPFGVRDDAGHMVLIDEKTIDHILNRSEKLVWYNAMPGTSTTDISTLQRPMTDALRDIIRDPMTQLTVNRFGNHLYTRQLGPNAFIQVRAGGPDLQVNSVRFSTTSSFDARIFTPPINADFSMWR